MNNSFYSYEQVIEEIEKRIRFCLTKEFDSQPQFNCEVLVAITVCHVTTLALIEILIQKGVFAREEISEILRLAAIKELNRYDEKIRYLFPNLVQFN